MRMNRVSVPGNQKLANSYQPPSILVIAAKAAVNVVTGSNEVAAGAGCG
jgi:hypothetical protein